MWEEKDEISTKEVRDVEMKATTSVTVRPAKEEEDLETRSIMDKMD